MWRVQVSSLVRELRSQMPQSVVKKKNTQKMEFKIQQDLYLGLGILLVLLDIPIE